jgi:Protein of unknown function (DUF3071)
MGGLAAPGAPVRQLHVVGFTSDHAGLILAGRRGAKTGSYFLALDNHLLGQIATARRVPQADSPRSGVGSALTPREIQARLRSGYTVAEVAAEAGVATDWIDRFAAPVLAEQAAAIDRAGRLSMQTPRRGASDRPLAAAVLRNLADRGIRLTNHELAEAWSAAHLVDHDWLVRFTFTSRGRTLDAEWTLDMAGGTLTPRNRLGIELGFVPSVSTDEESEPGFDDVETPQPPPRLGPAETAKKLANEPAKSAAASKAAAAKPSPGKGGAPKGAAEKGQGPEPPAKKASSRKAPPGPAGGGGPEIGAAPPRAERARPSNGALPQLEFPLAPQTET